MRWERSPCPTGFVAQIPRMTLQLAPKVEVVNAMTWNGRNGNPAGVVLDASTLNDQQRQELAARVGHSETAFVERSPDGRYTLTFFTPTRQIAFCGHATIATFAYLRCKGLETRDSVDVSIAGTDLRVHYAGDVVLMEQRAPRYERVSDADLAEALRSIGLEPGALDAQFRPQIVDTGNRFLLISVVDRAALARAVPHASAIESLSERLDLIGYYVFLRTPGEHAATTRMFAPRYGILEESATGMAAGPLAATLVDELGHKQTSLRILQGEFMNPPRPSEILAQVELRDSKVAGLRIGGRATLQPETPRA